LIWTKSASIDEFDIKQLEYIISVPGQFPDLKVVCKAGAGKDELRKMRNYM